LAPVASFFTLPDSVGYFPCAGNLRLRDYECASNQDAEMRLSKENLAAEFSLNVDFTG